MTNFEKIRTRIIIAQSVGLSPDNVGIIDHDDGLDGTLYTLDEFKGHNLCLGFSHVPTIEEAREEVKDLYLCGIEWEFDIEMEAI